MKQQPITMNVPTLVKLIQQIRADQRLGLLVGGLIATANELNLPEAEVIRIVRVGFVQHVIAADVNRKGGLIDSRGQPVMPTGDVELGRPVKWNCPLCQADIPEGVKHKHTAPEWMTGRLAQRSVEPALGGDCAIGPPAGELEDARREVASLEESPTFDEGTKRRERGSGDPYQRAFEGSLVCSACGLQNCLCHPDDAD